MINFGKNGYLIIGEFGQLRSVFELFYIHDFDGIECFVFSILTFVDIAVLPLSNFLHKDVIFDDFVHLIGMNCFSILNNVK
jgi:hypothetical protein